MTPQQTASQQTTPQQTIPQQATPQQVIPLTGMRGIIADKMTKSLQTSAQLTHHGDANASELIKGKKKLEEGGVKVSVEDLVVAAVVRALGRCPYANGRIEDDEIRLFGEVDMCIAIALPDNLLVAPAIFGANRMGVEELRDQRKNLAERAKKNELSVTEMTGGTFTVSNLGLTRVEHFTPIVNTPQICTLGVGRITNRPVNGEDGIELSPHIGLSLSFDHRAIDGAPAGELLTAICEEIEETGQ